MNYLIQASQRMKSKTDLQQFPYLVIVSGSHARIASHEYTLLHTQYPLYTCADSPHYKQGFF